MGGSLIPIIRIRKTYKYVVRLRSESKETDQKKRKRAERKKLVLL